MSEPTPPPATIYGPKGEPYIPSPVNPIANDDNLDDTQTPSNPLGPRPPSVDVTIPTPAPAMESTLVDLLDASIANLQAIRRRIHKP